MKKMNNLTSVYVDEVRIIDIEADNILQPYKIHIDGCSNRFTIKPKIKKLIPSLTISNELSIVNQFGKILFVTNERARQLYTSGNRSVEDLLTIESNDLSKEESICASFFYHFQEYLSNSELDSWKQELEISVLKTEQEIIDYNVDSVDITGNNIIFLYLCVSDNSDLAYRNLLVELANNENIICEDIAYEGQHNQIHSIGIISKVGEYFRLFDIAVYSAILHPFPSYKYKEIEGYSIKTDGVYRGKTKLSLRNKLKRDRPISFEELEDILIDKNEHD